MRIPFDISKRPQIESGEYKVETKDHHFVRIICWNKNTGGLDRIVALVAGDSGQEKTLHYTEEGWCCATGNNRDKDLLIVTPEPEMSEMEISLLSWLSDDTCGEIPMERMKQVVKARAAELLATAKQQLLQSGELLTKEHHEKLMETLREECKKDLPRWRIWRNGACGGSDGHPIALVHGAGGIRFVSCLGANGEKYIMLSDIEKLHGFEEEDYE